MAHIPDKYTKSIEDRFRAYFYKSHLPKQCVDEVIARYKASGRSPMDSYRELEQLIREQDYQI